MCKIVYPGLVITKDAIARLIINEVTVVCYFRVYKFENIKDPSWFVTELEDFHINSKLDILMHLLKNDH